MEELKAILRNKRVLINLAIALVTFFVFATIFTPKTPEMTQAILPKIKVVYETNPNQELEIIRQIWSPINFSAPNEFGFSEDFIKNENFETHIVRSSANKFSKILNNPLNSDKNATARLALSSTKEPNLLNKNSESIFKQSQMNPNTYVVQLRMRNEIAERLIDAPDFKELIENITPSWQYSAEISINEYGLVTDVFANAFESPSEPIPAQLITALQKLRFKKSDAPTTAQITIFTTQQGSDND